MLKDESKTSRIIRFILLTIVKYLTLFIIDGSIYILIELTYRGYSNISMFILGGLSGVLVGGLNNWYSWDLSLVKQMSISAVIITVLEYITGYIVNIRLGWNVWDYSDLPFNLNGQICLYFSVLWFFISFIAIIVDDELRYIFFNEEYKDYKLF
jgi:hypothetical protein